ncbi:MAG: transposase, partial [Mariprofundales bacterium]
MARQKRIHVHGGIYHVMLHGNGGMVVFSSEEDRCHFLLLLQEGTYRFGYRVHAFCLMDNHIHLAIQVSDVHLSEIMHNLSFRYTRWFNCHQKRFGHLFQGRYKATLVDENNYFLALVRYIHLNPVRASMVAEADDYGWSGHAGYLGSEYIPWLTTDYLLGQLAPNIEQARERYIEFVQAGVGIDHTSDFHYSGKDSRLLGDDNFMEQAYAKSGERHAAPPKLSNIIDHICRKYELEESELKSSFKGHKTAEARAFIAWLAKETGAATLTEVAEHFNRDIAA